MAGLQRADGGETVWDDALPKVVEGMGRPAADEPGGRSTGRDARPRAHGAGAVAAQARRREVVAARRPMRGVPRWLRRRTRGDARRQDGDTGEREVVRAMI